MDIFLANAAKLEQLSERANEAFRCRDEGPTQMANWQQATAAFHAAYDELAFPGGLAREFELLDAADPEAIEIAVKFLEADPRYFRSGYHKEDILKLLRKVTLSNDQTERLRRIILKHIQGKPTRETRAYCRFVPKVINQGLESELKRLAADGKRSVAQHAEFALQCLRSTNFQ